MPKIPEDHDSFMVEQIHAVQIFESRPPGELQSLRDILQSPKQRARAATEQGSEAAAKTVETPAVLTLIPPEQIKKPRPAARLSNARRSAESTLKPGAPTALRLMRSTLQGPLLGPELNGRELSILHSHSIFCQIGLPYRKPHDDVREFERANGNMRLKITAGEALHPETGEFVKVGLPWGAKVRLVQIYLESAAVSTQSATVETDRSLTAFITDKLRLDNAGGRTILSVKDALARLAASRFLFGIHRQTPDGVESKTFKGDILKHFDIWLPKDQKQRVLFPSVVHFDPDYFAELLQHAVPLKFSAVAALSHNTMALDCYRWLAQRLHRVPPGAPVLLFWSLLYNQFSASSVMRLADFRAEFKNALAQALSQYPEARNKVLIDTDVLQSLCKDGRGLWLYNAPPPVLKSRSSLSSFRK